MNNDLEEISLGKLTFKFKNNPDYIKETEELKKHFKKIIPEVEIYLKNQEIIERRKKQLEICNNKIFVWLIHPINPNSKKWHVGNIGFYEKSQLVIQLHPVLNHKKCKAKELFIETLLHEIFHLFFDGEEITKSKVSEFMANMN